MRPHRKPSTSAAKIAQTITNVTVIEHVLGLGRQLAAQEVTESFLLDWLDLSCGFQVSESAMKETRRPGKGTQQLTEARTVDPGANHRQQSG